MKDFNPELNEKINAAVSDDELEAVAGGVVQQISTGATKRVKCGKCGAIFMSHGYQDKCPMCSKVSSNTVGMNQEKNLIHKSVATQKNTVPIEELV